jgi:phosphate transport system substrate-binding protein
VAASQIKAGTVDFGATDKPLSAEELTQAGLRQLPVVIGGIIPIMAGIEPGKLPERSPEGVRESEHTYGKRPLVYRVR